jgi:WD40 repeat protein
LSDGDQHAGGEPPRARKRFGPAEKAVIIAAVIAAVATVLSTTLPGILKSPSDNQPVPPTSSSSRIANTPSSVSTPSAQEAATKAPPPVSPALTLYDPGSTGVTSVAFTASGGLVAGDLNGSAYLWNIASIQVKATFPSTNGHQTFGVSVSPGGTILAVSTVNSNYTEGSVILWNTETRKPVATLNDPDGHGSGNPVVFTKDGTILAVADSNADVYLWNSATAKLVGALPDPDSESGKNDSGLALSPSTGYLAAGDGDGTTYLWNIQTRQLVSTFHDPNSQGVTGGVAFSPDGTLLAAGDGNGNVYLWNVSTGALAATLHGPAGEAIGGVAFDPKDGIVAATSNNPKATKTAICIWNATHTLVATLHDPHSQGAYRLKFSPSGDVLAVGDANAHTYIWNMNWLY